MSIRTIKHDAFGRYSIIRKQIEPNYSNVDCSFCGQLNGHKKLFLYGNENDDSSRQHWDNKAFCSISCRNAYNGN
jgi:hypothetical protein